MTTNSNNNEIVNINLSLSLRQAHLLSIVCGLNMTVPQAAVDKSEFLCWERTDGASDEASVVAGISSIRQRAEVCRVLDLIKSQLQIVTPSACLAKTSEVFTNHPQGLI